jgi:hypothetical protein
MAGGVARVERGGDDRELFDLRRRQADALGRLCGGGPMEQQGCQAGQSEDRSKRVAVQTRPSTRRRGRPVGSPPAPA